MIEKIKNWLNAHPTVKGGLVAAESAVAAVAGTAFTNFLNGKDQFTQDSLRKLIGFFVTTAAIAFWNYVKVNASSVEAVKDAEALKASAAKAGQ
jgi:predicted transporter